MLKSYESMERFYSTMFSHHVDASTVTELGHSVSAVSGTPGDPGLRSNFVSYMLRTQRLVTTKLPFQETARRLVRRLALREETEPEPRAFQPSFISFLASLADEGFPLLIEQAHQDLAILCLDVMAAELRFNICHLSSSFTPNSAVPNLADLAATHISPQLRYACQCWLYHVAKLPTIKGPILDKIVVFFQSHFLPWLEVMSILNISEAKVLADLRSLDLASVCCPTIFCTA